jgi:hypothetical protein
MFILHFISNLVRLFFKELLLLGIVTFKAEVDWNGRVLDSCGKCEEAQLTPHGKRAFLRSNQLSHTEIATIYTKTAKSINCHE